VKLLGVDLHQQLDPAGGWDQVMWILGVLVNSQLNMSWQYAQVAKNASWLGSEMVWPAEQGK